MSGTTPTELQALRQHAAGLWRPVVPLLAGVLLWTLLCFRDTFLAMAEIWARSETFTHGFVVPPLAGWLIWRQRERLARLAPSPEPWILLPLAVVGFGWLLGHLASVNAVTQLAATAMLVLAAVAVVGLRVARAIAFPLAFLFFAVPIGEFVMPRLMEWTADFTVVALRLTGIPVYREGLSFVIPSGNWSVVEACSGVRYLIASLMVGTLFAYLNYRSLRRRLVFVGVSIVVPIFANWLRAYMIVMLGHVSGNTLAVGVDHLIYGWLFFGLVIMLMFYIGARWSEEEEPLPELAAPGAAGGAGPSCRRRRWAVMALALPAIAWPVAAKLAVERSDAAPPPRLALPAAEAMGGWQQVAPAEADIVPAYENPPATAAAAFARDGRSVGLYVAYYRNQGYGQKLVTSTNTLVRSKDTRWTVVGQGSQALAAAGGPARVRTYDLAPGLTSAAAGTEHLAVWQWYWINGRLTASDAEAKLYTAWSRLKGEGDDSAVVFIYARQPTGGSAAEALAAFVADAGGAVNAMLGQARAAR